MPTINNLPAAGHQTRVSLDNLIEPRPHSKLVLTELLPRIIRFSGTRFICFLLREVETSITLAQLPAVASLLTR